jgi:hypothetical protein
MHAAIAVAAMRRGNLNHHNERAIGPGPTLQGFCLADEPKEFDVPSISFGDSKKPQTAGNFSLAYLA